MSEYENIRDERIKNLEELVELLKEKDKLSTSRIKDLQFQNSMLEGLRK